MAKKPQKKSKESSQASLANQFGWNTASRARSVVITPQDLRNLSYSNNIVRICINAIKHSVSRIEYIVRAKDEKQKDLYKAEIDYVKSLLKQPNPNDETFRSLISKLCEDILVLDNGVVEKVRNPLGYVVEMYNVDGATIKPCINEYGQYEDPAFKQYLAGFEEKASAEFEANELLVFQVNPQVQNGFAGIGKSPVEAIIQTVTASLQAAIYNNSIFNEQKIPPFVANLAGVPTEQLTAFKLAFEQSLAGNPWAMAWTNATNLDVKSLRPSNQEMQFYELNKWLATIIFAAFEVSPQDFGFTMDVNRATAEVQERIAKSRGIANILDVIAEEINNDLISDLAEVNPKFNEIEFAWDNMDKLEAKEQAEIDKIYVEIGKNTINELRARDGQDPIEQPQLVDKKKVEEKEPIQKSYEELEKWTQLYQ